MDKGITSGLYRERIGGQLSEELRVMSGVSQGSVLGPLLFLEYVNYIWRNNESTIRLFADDCIIYRKILNNDMENSQLDLNWLREWGLENETIINPTKNKAICFMKARVTEPLNYLLQDTVIQEVSSCKYLGIILYSDFSWADQVSYTVKKAWKALHFIMHILKKGNSNTTNLVYTLLVSQSLESGAASWNRYREGQIKVLDQVQNKAAKFAHHRNFSNWRSTER
jgi:hypothetical protein